MKNSSIETTAFLPLILRILSEFNLNEDNLVIDDNPHKWAKERSLSNIKDAMIGYSFKDQLGGIIILLKKTITDEDRRNVLQRISFKVNRGRIAFLSEPDKFVEHLVRHELEHCIGGKPQSLESEADEAALQQMGFKEIGSGF